ncbi:DNA-3-methyladenine glycosylase 2 family protein [Sporolactobacillus shoreae]|uniref:DNA-3-methyladenine glycosylase II n=1 Tax=Sporolactobacillus shoreae TaxID=1465501 RepID=A0A4Z0GPD8_9BACL|nr:DNA-3-methyladenine glycosylase [Sporolactobacillus shoreae]TGA98868.1 DNA-3-methyladenine glycosylase 2 family protein [Sporolactobacillus shoreae]
MNGIDHESSISIKTPEPFSFSECLIFLGRSDQEVLHQIHDDYLFKLLKMDGSLILIKVSADPNFILIEFPDGVPNPAVRSKIAAYVKDWFDLGRDLSPFYAMASQDKILKQLIQKYYGLRMICIPDLFEALAWGITGQQINLTFAYTLKKRMIQQFGEHLTYKGNTFWLFPSAEKIAGLHIEDLKILQFSSRKAEYILEIAKAIRDGILTKESLLQAGSPDQIQESLTVIRGIGKWTSSLAMMRCLRIPTAFPIADVGLHLALKKQLSMDRKPFIEEIEGMASYWEGWQAYATFYLWRSRYE